MTIETKAQKEKLNMLESLKACNIPAHIIDTLEPTIENTAWMKVKLDEVRKTIKDSSVAIGYNNGGGQKGIRENPLFKGYEALWKSYISGMNIILAYIPEDKKDSVEKVEKPKTVLELVRDKHGKGA